MNINFIFNRTVAGGPLLNLNQYPYLFSIRDDRFGICILSSRLIYAQSKTNHRCVIGGFNIRYKYAYINDQEIIDRINNITTYDELIAYFNSDELFRQEILKIVDMLEQLHSDLIELRDYQIIPYDPLACQWRSVKMKQEFINIKDEIHLAKYLNPRLCVNSGRVTISICHNIEILADSLVGLGNPDITLCDKSFDYKYLYSVFYDLLCIINNKVNKYMYRTTTVKSAR